MSDLPCSHPKRTLVRQTKANGSVQLYRRCDACGNLVGGVRHSDVANIEALPSIGDARRERPPCVVCGTFGVELHHWAPRELFSDAEMWPTSWLCPSCHARWHETMSQQSKRSA